MVETGIFHQHASLVVVVPVLLGLKCCLEMTLASRLSTAHHKKTLPSSSSEAEKKFPVFSFIKAAICFEKKGPFTVPLANIGVVQIQAAVVGLLASAFALIVSVNPSFISSSSAPILVHSPASFSEAIMLIASCETTAYVTSFLLGIFTVILIKKSAEKNVDPDNISGPLVTSVGDLIALFILYVTSTLCHSSPHISLLLLFLIFVTLPFFARQGRQHRMTFLVLINGWNPIIANLSLSCIAGLFLQADIEKLSGGLAILVPFMNGTGGCIASIYSSRYGTALHKGKDAKHTQTVITLISVALPIHILFLLLLLFLKQGEKLSFSCCCCYLSCVSVQLLILLYLGRYLGRRAWALELDPDNHVIPYLNAVSDFFGTLSIVMLAKGGRIL